MDSLVYEAGWAMPKPMHGHGRALILSLFGDQCPHLGRPDLEVMCFAAIHFGLKDQQLMGMPPFLATREALARMLETWPDSAPNSPRDAKTPD